ncbi:GNAT family N-acetyltransferase [Nocardia brasiliensis]|uniref:GNAT family N-acetyltransferase n=1 Tax=Nocardia brasiliensis TaxID=37326 RepID=A0A6G9XY17_NOCBR|nr:GNAT family N-acetyltransferase [Nocardia brasiliensis]QIS05814.1 GNAT family N-acetyltransferase [Nocardia brasiliensis]
MTESTGELPRLELRRIDRENLYAVCALSETLSVEQRPMVIDNSVSIAEAHFSDCLWYRAVYADDVPAGFLMVHLGLDEDHPELRGVFLWRFMVAAPAQGRGIGRAVLGLLVDRLTAQGVRELYTSYATGPGTPAGFYRALGFEPTGRILDGEHEVVLRW